MTYIPRQDLVERIGEEELVLLSDRNNDGEADEAVIDRALADATDELNMHLACRYRLPLVEVPDTLKRLAVNLCLYWLCDSARSMSELVKERYESGIKTLRALGNGTLRLGLPELEAPEENTGGSVQRIGPERRVNSKNLGGVL